MKLGLLALQWALIAVQIGSIVVLTRRRKRAERLERDGQYGAAIRLLQQDQPYSALAMWLIVPIVGLMVAILAL